MILKLGCNLCNGMNLPVVLLIGLQSLSILFELYKSRKLSDSDSDGDKITPHDIYMLIKNTTYKCLGLQERNILSIASIILASVVLILLKQVTMLFGFIFGFIMIKILTRLCAYSVLNGNYKTALSCKQDLSKGFNVAYSYGLIGGLFISIGMLVLYMLYKASNQHFDNDFFAIGMIFAISLNAFISRSSSGIYTKSCDVGADLLGKISAQMNEDSIENPLFIADNVGDNIGDAISAMNGIIEISAFGMLFIMTSLKATIFLLSTLIFSSISVIVLPKIINIYSKKMETQDCVVNRIVNIFKFSIVSIIAGFAAVAMLHQEHIPNTLLGVIQYICILSLIIISILVTVYFTYDKFKPIHNIARSTEIGYAPLNIIRSMGESMIASSLIMIVIVLQFIISLFINDMLLLSSAIMIGLIPLIMTNDLYGPIVDNAGGIAESGGMHEDVRKNTDILDQMGNMSKALTKSYAAILMSIVCILSITKTQLINIIKSTVAGSATNPLIMYIGLGVLFGGAAIFAFSGVIMNAVDSISQNAMRTGKELLLKMSDKSEHDQIAEMKKNAYNLPTIVMQMSIQQVITLFITAIVQYLPILIALIMNQFAAFDLNKFFVLYIFGLQLGSLSSGALMSVFMTVCGGAMDNVSKYIDAKYNPKKNEMKSKLKSIVHEINQLLGAPCKIQLEFDGCNVNIVNNLRSEDITDAALKNKLSNMYDMYKEYINYCDIVNGGSGGDIVGDPLKDAAGNTLTSIVIFTSIISYLLTTSA